jgi:CRP-like cAMP-binding protein
VFGDILNLIWSDRQKNLSQNFGIFKEWESSQLRSLVTEAKDRVLSDGEFLFKDGTTAHFMYFLLEGTLRIEKEVYVTQKNYWPA